MPKTYDLMEQRAVCESLTRIVAANADLRQARKQLYGLDPTFIFDYWEASSTEREWHNYYHEFVDKDGNDFRKDVNIITDWHDDHISIVGTAYHNESHIEFDIPYTWFTHRATLLAEFKERDDKEAAKKKQQEIVDKQARISQLQAEIKELQGS